MAKIKITQTGSPIRRTDDQRATLKGLGLNKMHKTVELEDSPEVRGMIRATFDALTDQTSPKSVAQRRGKKVADLLGRGGGSQAEAEAEAAAVVE